MEWIICFYGTLSIIYFTFILVKIDKLQRAVDSIEINIATHIISQSNLIKEEL